jgi:hypothetical protein
MAENFKEKPLPPQADDGKEEVAEEPEKKIQVFNRRGRGSGTLKFYKDRREAALMKVLWLEGR